MHIQNKLFVNLLTFLLITSILAIGVDIAINYVPGQVSEWLPGYNLSFFILIAHLLLAILGVNTFSFKDDYEILMVYSKNFYALPSWGWAHSYHEFPKRKLLGFKIKKFLFLRFIQLHLDSKEQAFFTSNINVTWISSSDLESIGKCLTETIENYQNQSANN
jgi:hypothetical protein